MFPLLDEVRMEIIEKICLREFIHFIKESQVDQYIHDFTETWNRKKGHHKGTKNSLSKRIIQELDYISHLDEENRLEIQLDTYINEYIKNPEADNEYLVIEGLLDASYIHRNILINYIPRFTKDIKSALCITHEINGYYHRWEKWVLERMHRMHKELLAARNKEIQQIFSLIDNLPQKAWVYNPHTGQVFYNQRWVAYTGLGQEDTFEISTPIPAVHPDENIELNKVIENALNKKHSFEFYCRLRGSNNNYRWHLLRGVPILDKNGQPSAWTGTYTDIHDEYLKNLSLIKTSEEKIEDLSEQIKDLTYVTKDQSNFIYMASHDLKAPLSNIQGLIEMLKDSLPDNDPEVSTVLKMIDTALSRFRNTLHEISQVVHQADASEEVNFSELMKEVKENLSIQIQETDASIYTEFKSVPSIKSSKKNIYTLFTNLISNSIKYRSPDRKPKITIRSERRDRIVALTFKDNASGMDLTKKDIFKKGERLNSDVEGSGIGLFLVKNIVENMGGKISVESDPGKGSIFKIFLPFH